MSVVRRASFMGAQADGYDYTFECDGDPKALRRAFQALPAVVMFRVNGSQVSATMRTAKGLTQPGRPSRVIDYLNHHLVLTQTLTYDTQTLGRYQRVVVTAKVRPSSEDVTSLKNHHKVANVRRRGDDLEVTFNAQTAVDETRRIISRLLLY